MSKEIAIAWKIRVGRGDSEVEVVGMTPRETKELFDQVTKEYGILPERGS